MENKMKKTLLIFIAVFIFSLVTSCSPPEDIVLNSLGEYEHSEYYTKGEFQDYTDYAIYYFSSAKLDENDYFHKLQQSDIDSLNEHLNDFEDWIELYREGDFSEEIVVNYKFDRSIVDEEDYIHIDSEKLRWDDGSVSLVNYDIYFYDSQTNVLYFFHNNT